MDAPLLSLPSSLCPIPFACANGGVDLWPLSLPVSEEQCLYQIYIDELYGGLQRPSEDEKKK